MNETDTSRVPARAGKRTARPSSAARAPGVPAGASSGQRPARPERQVLAHPPVLHQQRRHRIARDVGLDRGVPDGETADGARRGHVPREQPRRDGQDGGVVVEAERHVVGREQGLRVDLQVQQVAHRVGVLQPVEPMNRRAPRVGMVGRPPVERPLEPGAERVVDGRLGPRAPGRRHRPRVQLLKDLLPQLGVRAHLIEIGGVEGEVPGQGPPVVAGDAVAVEDGPVRRRRNGLPGRRLGRCTGGLRRRPSGLRRRARRATQGGAHHDRPDPSPERRPPTIAHHRRPLHHRLRRIVPGNRGKSPVIRRCVDRFAPGTAFSSRSSVPEPPPSSTLATDGGFRSRPPQSAGALRRSVTRSLATRL